MPTRMWRMAAILPQGSVARIGCRLRAVKGEHMRHHVIAALLGTVAYAWPALAADRGMTIKMEIDVAETGRGCLGQGRRLLRHQPVARCGLRDQIRRWWYRHRAFAARRTRSRRSSSAKPISHAATRSRCARGSSTTCTMAFLEARPVTAQTSKLLYASMLRHLGQGRPGCAARPTCRLSAARGSKPLLKKMKELSEAR